MGYKMRKQETEEAMGRGRDTLTRRNFSKRRQRGGFAKKGMAYFLSFLMLAGNLQSVSYASENAQEIAEQMGVSSEASSPAEATATEQAENSSGVGTEAAKASGEESEQEAQSGEVQETASEDAPAVKQAGEEQENSDAAVTEEKDASVEESKKEETSEEGANQPSEEAGKEAAQYMEAGSFAVSYKDLTVTAEYPEGTFQEGTQMKLLPLEKESVVEEAKSLLEKNYEKEYPGMVPLVEVLDAVDISFVREVDGVEKEVQPKNGKKVEIRLQKTEKIKEVLAEEDKDLRIVHLPEGLPAEILPVKEEGEDLLFSAKHFSPIVATAVSAGQSASAHDFKAFWMESPDPDAGTSNAKTGHSYTDGSNGVMRDQRDLKIIPPEKASNATNTTTLGVELTLKGNKNTKYAPGTVIMEIPARIFKGWDSAEPDKISVYEKKNNNQHKLQPAITTGVPKAPNTNPQSSFNYTIIQKDIGGGRTEEYFRLANFRELTGGLTFKADIAYNLTPTMLAVTHQQINGQEKGVFDNTFPVSMKIDHSDSSLDAEEDKTLSVHVETEVKETNFTLKHGTADVNQGVYFTWDPSGGKKPDDAEQYFYGVWYVRVDRAKGSSQPFDYVFHAGSPLDSDGGTLIGAKKLPSNVAWNNYFYNNIANNENNIEVYAKNGYANIAKYMGVGENPPANAPYLENPIDRTYVGIPKDPSVPNLPVGLPYAENLQYANAHYNSQLYALLYKYPMQKLEDAKNDGINLATQGLPITNKIHYKEIWADGYVREKDVTPKDPMMVYVHPSTPGDFVLKKYNTVDRKVYIGIFGLQSIYKDGGKAPVVYSNWNDSFTLSSNYKADDNSVAFGTDGKYTTSGTSGQPGSGTTITDGKYKLFSTSRISVNNQNVEQTLGSGAFSNLPHDNGTNADAYRGPVYDLTDDDYHYSKIYMKDMKVYDVEKVDNPIIRFAKKGDYKKEYAEYPPVEIWLRRKGTGLDDYFKYGTFRFDAGRRVQFTPEPGYEDKWDLTQNKASHVTHLNQLDLEKAFGNNIVGLRLKQDSPYYRTSFDAAFTLQITPQPAMQSAIATTMARTDGYNISFLAGDATGEVRQLGVQRLNKRAGDYFTEVGYGLEPLNINSELAKTNAPYVDHPERSEQSMQVFVRGLNWGTFPTSLQQDEYTDKYVLKKGDIYDLLPAGTYVDESSIIIGNMDQAEIPPEEKRFVKGKDYTVEFKKNWENSGQTMMIIHLTIPDDKQHRYWDKFYNRSGWRMAYTLWNPYTNIVDRGRSVVNTVGFINKDANTIWDGNYSNGKTPNPSPALLGKYTAKRDEAAHENGAFTTSVTSLTMPYGPVTVLEATFNNTVSTEIDSRYLGNNVSYMGDPYNHRLLYQASATSRTTDLVIFDILGEEKDRNGDFTGVDINSMLSKRSYDKTNANNQDTLKPRVFYSTVIPTPEQRDLGKPLYDAAGYAADTNHNNPKFSDSIWKEWNYENESANTVDRKEIKALAFDLRTTEAGKRFILDQQGLILANVNMVAHMDQKKIKVENTNVAYRTGILFPGNDVPQNVAPDTVQSSSKHRLVEPVVFNLPVKKVLDVPAGLNAPSIQGKFTFTLSGVDGAPLLDEEGNAIDTVKRNPDANGGMVNFGKIRLLKPGTYQYKIHESGQHLDGVQSEDMGDKFITITVTDPNHVKMESDLQLSETNPMTFTNVYGVQAIDPEIKVEKFLSATAGVKKPDISNTFTFTLKRVNGEPMPAEAGTADSLSKTNPDAIGGEVNFGRVHITRPGVYKYTVTESGLFPGIVNDPRPTREITITVNDLGNGHLFALVGGDDFNYTNVFKPTPTQGQVDLGKKISGLKPPKADPFRFVLRTETMEISSNSVYWTDKREDPIFNDKEIFFNNGNGNDTFEEYLDPDNNVIRNKKIVSNSDLEEGVLYGSSGLITEVKPSLSSMPKGLFQPMPEGSQSETEMVVIAGEGHTEFAPITFHVPGKYVYTVKELKDGISGYTYDNSVYTVVFTVTQSTDSKETLMVSKKIYKNGAEVSEILFDNKYNPYRPGGGGGTPNRPSFPTPNTPGGPGEPPAEPEKPTLPEEPQNPTPDNGNNVPPSPTVPRTIEEIQKRIGEILGAGRKRPLTPEEEAELKRLGEVLGALRKAQSRKVNTADASHLLWYAFASALSFSLLSIYYFLRKLKKKR